MKNPLVDITVCGGPLGADEVVGLLGEGRVQHQARPVHQVEQVAVVGPEVQHRQRLGPGVGLEDDIQIKCLV